MQISRHWRLNPQRYRLQGVRYENGTVSLQARPLPITDSNESQADREAPLVKEKATLMAGR
jgi:hypothetical protein